MKTKIISVVGARPQFVKAAVLHRALLKVSDMRPCLIHTGQHYNAQMSQVFFDELGIAEPDYNLGVGSGSHADQTGRMLIAIESVFREENPICVIVYGDTNSTLAAALAAVKLHIPVLHVEAGLRSFNRRMPEEVNRVLTDHMSDILFAPTDQAASNLQLEGISDERIHQVGDVMYDAALFYAKIAKSKSQILDTLNLSPTSYALATVHRAENTDDFRRLSTICETLRHVARSLPVVLPLHPRTRRTLETSGWQHLVEGVRLIDPIGYLDMLMLERNARIIMTDSGGVQKEAFFYQVPCVTFRDETEWTELVDSGWNRLAPPTSTKAQVEQIEASLGSVPTKNTTLYGTGNAAVTIAEIIQRLFLSAPGENAARFSTASVT